MFKIFLDDLKSFSFDFIDMQVNPFQVNLKKSKFFY